MSEIRFTKDHEYVRVDGDIGTVGITDYAQQQLGDVVHVELPAVGAKFDSGAAAAVVESVKAASDIFAPVSGVVVEANAEVDAEPALINQDPLARGWLMKIKLTNPSEVRTLMTQSDYDAFLKTLD
jgi:glycine cleavage system H protein